MPANADLHLKKACQLTGATWAALAGFENGRWFVQSAANLSKARRQALTRYMALPPVAAWLEVASKAAAVRPAKLPKSSGLSGARLRAISLRTGVDLILVGGGGSGAPQNRLWRLMADMLSTLGAEAGNDLLPSLETELAYDMPRALDRLLLGLVRVVEPQGAWLAIRRGDALHVEAEWNDTRLADSTLAFDSSKLLRRLHRTLAAVTATAADPDWAHLPHAVRRSSTFWLCLPFVVGQRLIGAVGMWSEDEIDPALVRQLRELTRQLSQPIEMVVTLNELTIHLRSLAMLNDFALAVSSAESLDQIARRVFGHLTRTFGAECAGLYLPSADARLLREYRSLDGKLTSRQLPLAEHPILPYLTGKILRLADSSAEFVATSAGARSGLMVPLKVRGQTIGLLALESTRPAAFTRSDEHLLVVIASHLAGLIEYGRVREDAEARARNLGLIHEVVQQVIGLNDRQEVAQITADLLSQYFAYESAAVLLLEPDSNMVLTGVGGSNRGSLLTAWGDGRKPLEQGVTGQVFRSGVSILVDDLGADPSAPHAAGGGLGSEFCVPLKQGESVLGLIDVRGRESSAFSRNDQLAIESLAGVLSTVVSSASQFGRLEETVRQLREAQVEVRSRLAAQQQAETRLVQAAKLAAVGEMAAGIAHELNNPLTTVTGFAELIRDETPPDDPHRADVEMVLQEAVRARNVVRRLLDFARQGEHTRARSDLNELVDDVLALTRHFIHTSGVQLEVELEKDLPWVLVDSNQIKQVFLNLVHNALHAMPAGGRLEICTQTAQRDNRTWVMVRVKDTGIGIEPGDLDRIFEPFFTTRGSRGGTGLGLSVSYGIVMDHGGRIDVESRPRAGSAFSVWLPT
jgi:signal transduction histidine kinase